MIYLLHFDKPFHHARHYIGYTKDERTFKQRMELHRNPDGGSHHSLMRAVHAAGIGFTVARTWPNGTRDEERAMKNRKKSSRYCPICKEKAKNDKKNERKERSPTYEVECRN